MLSRTLVRHAPCCLAGTAPGHPAAGSSTRDYKVALITGANTGIGFETAKALSKQGYYVVMGCRDAAKGEAARVRIKQEVPNARGLEIAQFDLSDLESVRSWAQRAQDFGLPLDVLVNNAGIMAVPDLQLTAQGHELQFGVNHLGHFLLTNMLLPLMTGENRQARIINVASAAHFFGVIDFDDLGKKGTFSRERNTKYDPWRAYGQSKLANILFTYELARRLPGSVTVNALHPGIVASELGRYLFPNVPDWMLGVARVFALSPSEGAKTSVYLASSLDVAGITGKYWEKCQQVNSSKLSYDLGVASRLWELSSEFCGIESLATTRRVA